MYGGFDPLDHSLLSSIVTDLVMACKTSHTSSSDLSVHCALQEASEL